MRRMWIAGCVSLALLCATSCDDPPAEHDPSTTAPPMARGLSKAPAPAPHPIAGRSPFPLPGETLDEPIPAKRLSDEEQFSPRIAKEDIPDIVPWDEAKKYMGHTITVEGRIVSVGQSGDGKVNFLNFDVNWRGKFYMVIFDDLADTLNQSVEEMFKGKRLRVTGEVEPHRGRPQIKIKSLDQVQIIDE